MKDLGSLAEERAGRRPRQHADIDSAWSRFRIHFGIVSNLPAVEQPPSALSQFVDWLAKNQQPSKTDGRLYNYHPRSNSHSLWLCRYIMKDLLARSEIIKTKAHQGRIAVGFDVEHTFPTGKRKKLDLAVGIPKEAALAPTDGIVEVREFSRVLVACEAKNCMTEHKKSQPRLFDELSSSYHIVNHGDPQCIAAGIAIINNAVTFVSPLRQHHGLPIHISKHDQPRVTTSMIAHLRGLKLREKIDEVGFDAFAQAIVDCNNQNGASLHEGVPAPQHGEADHFDTFLQRIDLAFQERFGSI